MVCPWRYLSGGFPHFRPIQPHHQTSRLSNEYTYTWDGTSVYMKLHKRRIPRFEVIKSGQSWSNPANLDPIRSILTRIRKSDKVTYATMSCIFLGIIKGDEIMVINGAIVSDLDMMYIESVLQVHFNIIHIKVPLNQFNSAINWINLVFHATSSPVLSQITIKLFSNNQTYQS